MLQVIMSRFGIEKYLSSRYFSSWLILTIDTVVSVVSTLIAYLLVRGLFTNPVFTVWYGFWLLAGSCVLSVFSFIVFRTFRSVIRHTTLREIWKLGGAVLFKDLLMFFYVLLLPQKPSPPYAALSMGFLLDVLVTLFLLLALRLCMIVVYDLIKLKQSRRANSRQVLVYGTGDKSVSLVTRLQNSPHYRVVGFLTYGKSLRKHTIAECPVYYFENQHSVEYLRDRVDVDAILFATNDDAQQEQERLIAAFSEIAVKQHLQIHLCCENRSLVRQNVDADGCLSQSVLEQAIGCRLKVPQQKRARDGCPCLLGADIGAYNTCGHECLYCYANYDSRTVRENRLQHDPRSPLLIGHVQSTDIVKDAIQRSWKDPQMSIFDLY